MGWGVGEGWEVAKKLQLGHHQCSNDIHTMALSTLVGHRGSGSNLMSHHLIGALHWCHYFSHEFGGLTIFPPGQQAS